MVITPVMACVCQDANVCVLHSFTDGLPVKLCLKFRRFWQFHSPKRLQVMENVVVPLRQLNIMLHCVLPSAGASFRTGDRGRNRGRVYHKSNPFGGSLFITPSMFMTCPLQLLCLQLFCLTDQLEDRLG